MKLKNAAERSFVIVVIVLLSILCGYIYQNLGHRADLHAHPREYEEYVTKYAAEYGVPEHLIYAMILTGSKFESNHVSEDGRVGLMQISPESFQWMLTLTKENLEPGILYDPETNIRYGTYVISYLYTNYNRWKNALALFYADDRETAELWMDSPVYSDGNGNLKEIPDPDLAALVDRIELESEMYRKLYD